MVKEKMINEFMFNFNKQCIGIVPLDFHLCPTALLQGRFKGNHIIVTILKMNHYIAIPLHNIMF